MILCHPADLRANTIPVEQVRWRGNAQPGRHRRPAGQPALPFVRRQHQRLAMVDGGKIAIGGTCHHHEPVLVAAPQQKPTKRHDPAIGQLHMPGLFRGRPFIPAAGNDQAATMHERLAKGRFFSRGFHPCVDQEAASLATRRQAPCRKDRLRLKSGLGDDKSGLRRGHIPSRLQIVHYRHAEKPHQLFRRGGTCKAATHGVAPVTEITGIMRQLRVQAKP